MSIKKLLASLLLCVVMGMAKKPPPKPPPTVVCTTCVIPLDSTWTLTQAFYSTRIAVSTANQQLTFTFPQTSTNIWAGYLTRKMTPGLDISGAHYLTITAQIDADSSVAFNYLNPIDPDNGGTTPAAAHPFIESSTAADPRWWANPTRIALVSGVATITIPLSPDQWSDVDGHLGSIDPTLFLATLKNIDSVGMSFGGGYFFGHGVSISNGTAVFHVLGISFF